MRLSVVAVAILCTAAACSNNQHKARASDKILAISFPGFTDKPSSENLIRGTHNAAQVEPPGSMEGQLSEALLRCGIKKFSWTSMTTDRGSRLILADNDQTRLALKCVTKIFPYDFYVRPESAQPKT